MATPKENVLAVYTRATDADILAGRLWYRSAREQAANLGKQYRKSTAQIAGIIAALSPQTGWKTNLVLAARGLANRGKFTGNFRDATEKARRIYHGESPETVLGGHKVRSFYQNIMSGGEGDNPTIDRHALSICLGRDSTEEERKQLGSRVSRQRECKNAYRVAAILAGITAAEMQAITWVTWRRERGMVD